MNIGIYLKSIADIKKLTGIDSFINNGLSKNVLKDASIFYDDVGFNETSISCGMFNSTDLWNFSGNLIVTSFDSLVKAKKIVNNINLIYYYGWEDRGSIFATIASLTLPNKIICRTEDDSKYLKRISSKDFPSISENFDAIMGVL